MASSINSERKIRKLEKVKGKEEVQKKLGCEQEQKRSVFEERRVQMKEDYASDVK